MRAPREVSLQLGEPDEHQRQQRARVPLVVEQDVEVRQHVRVQQVRLVEEKDGVDFVPVLVGDVSLDG